MKRVLIVFLFSSLWIQPGVGQLQESYFGLHQNKYMKGEPWPTVPFGIRRTVSDLVKWSDLETCPGGPDPGNPCYHWGKNPIGGDLDKIVNDSNEHGVDVMFTIYSVPPWASSRPDDRECGGQKSARLEVFGSCDPPPDVDAVAGSGQGDGSDKTFKDFVTAAATRYGKKIKYWEMWNEAPNIRFGNPDYWTFKQWARMTKDFHDAVKAANPDAIVLAANTCKCPPPGSAKFRPWTEGYFSALDKYGPAIVDAVSYHGYRLRPEEDAELIEDLRQIADQHSSTRGKPIYDTEDAWPGRDRLQKADGTPDWEAQSGWLARSMILNAAEGVKSYILFGWDLKPKSKLWDYDKSDGCTTPNKEGQAGYLCPTALAYEQFHDWLLGAVFDRSCSTANRDGGTIWTCDFSKNNGAYHGRFVWYDGSGSVSYSPDRFTASRDLEGNSMPLKTKSSIPIGNKPVLLEMK